MEISDQAVQLLAQGGLFIELDAVVLGCRVFKAAGQDAAKVTVVGTRGGPMGHNVHSEPYGVFELDADIEVFRSLSDQLAEPARFRFKADLKPINTYGGYVVHLLELLE